MNEIAKAAGCSRATLYRYFDSREALRTAYVHRETRRLGREIMVKIADVVEPAERLLVSITTTLRMVRDNPALAAVYHHPPTDRRRDGRTVRGDRGPGRGIPQLTRSRRSDHRRTPRPLGGPDAHIAADVPRP